MTGNLTTQAKRKYCLVIACTLVYVASVFVRLAASDLTSTGNLIGVTTPDAYGWLTAIQNTGILRNHVLAYVARLFLATEVIGLGTFALYSPVFVSSITAPLLVYWGYRNKSLSCGIFAGLIATQLPAFYSRTSFGYFDSDAVVAPLLVLVIIVFQFWHLYVTRSALAEQTSQYRVFLYTVLVSLLLFFSHQVHVSFIFNTLFLVLVSAILNRKSIPHLIYVVLISMFSYIGVVLSAAILLLSSHWDAIRLKLNLTAKGQQRRHLTIVFGIIAFFILLIGGFMPGFDLTERIRDYIGNPIQNIIQSFTDEPSILGIVVQELEPKTFREVLQVATGNVYFSLLGLATIPYLLISNRNSLFFLFPLVLGLFSPMLGIRFTLFLSLPLAISVAFFIASMTEKLIDHEHNRVFIVASLATFYWYQLFNIYEESPPRVFGNAHANAALITLGSKISDPCDVSLISWENGYAANFYANLPTLLSGGTRTVGSVSAYSKMLLTRKPSSEVLSAHARDIFAHQDFTFRQEYKNFDCRFEDMSNKDLHVVITWDDLLNFYWWVYYSNQLNQFRGSFIVLKEIEKLDQSNGIIYVEDSPLRLLTTDIINDARITTKRYPDESSWRLIYNERTNAGIVVDTSLYRTFILDVFLNRLEVKGFKHRFRDSSTAIVSIPLRTIQESLDPGKPRDD